MKITPEIAEKINILYLELGTKAAVAREIGCSPSTVSRYIVPNFVPPAERTMENFEKEVGNADWLISLLQNSESAASRLCEICLLSEEEKAQLKTLQKEIFV